MGKIASLPDFVVSSVQSHMNTWSDCVSDISRIRFPGGTKHIAEPATEILLDKVIGQLSSSPVTIPDQHTLKSLFIGVFHCEPDFIFSQSYKKATVDFLKKVRCYDNFISTEEIYQAIRNLWIANSIQYLLGLEVRLSEPLFAYSMLYPYTDNLLDGNELDVEEKKEFNARFRKKLAGEEVVAKLKLEARIFEMVSIIEKYYSRIRHKVVYDSLLAIHDAQGNSISLNHDEIKSLSKVIRISFEKGGTSVLADGFLAAGNLTHDQAHFLMGFGIMLQMLDDLQDLQDDYLHHQQTLFSVLVDHSILDEPASKLLDFIMKICSYGESVFPGKDNFFNIIRNCSITLLSRAAHKNKAFFSSGFIDILEKETGHSGSFYARQNEKIRTIDKDEVEKYLQHILDTEGERT